MMSWITQGLDKLVPQPPGHQPEQQPEVGPQVLQEVLLRHLHILMVTVVFVMLSFRFSSQQQLQVRLRSTKGPFRRPFLSLVSLQNLSCCL